MLELICAALLSTALQAHAAHDPAPEAAPVRAVPKNDDVVLRSARVRYDADVDQLVFEQRVAGVAGRTRPQPAGSLEGAPVLGYVFPTTLAATDVGFSATEGIVALAVTSHPDFDDSPLWDENGDGRYDNDGLVYHTHWVVLAEDSRVPGGLSVKEFRKGDAVVLPPTNGGMTMYMDSPGFNVATRGDALRVVVPATRVRNRTDFRYDAVTAYMQVATTGNRPMLGVYEVYSVLSGDLSLPYKVEK